MIGIVLLDINKSTMLFFVIQAFCFLKLCYKLLCMNEKLYKEVKRRERKYKDSTKKTDSEKEKTIDTGVWSLAAGCYLYINR